MLLLGQHQRLAQSWFGFLPSYLFSVLFLFQMHLLRLISFWMLVLLMFCNRHYPHGPLPVLRRLLQQDLGFAFSNSMWVCCPYFLFHYSFRIAFSLHLWECFNVVENQDLIPSHFLPLGNLLFSFCLLQFIPAKIIMFDKAFLFPGLNSLIEQFPPYFL